ncbi:phosphatidylserine decarboxylase [Nevskia soli]|jgi:phosphatidylserine decarboxylase|uniref:phosphatidylserine decarboxylase n=1 Tax=Nevskia soli TaxID=418856 RepID=UPI0015D73B74|nr:phosphatidylserine decarboxylase [Nevskia soli]
MVRDGVYYAAGFTLAAAVIAWLTNPWLALPLFIVGAFCAWFFRDPERMIPAGPVAVSPADGRVVSVVEEAPGITRISIFLNIFDVHVNRAPISGIISSVNYQKGMFLAASRTAASVRNEQNQVTIQTEDTQVVFKQIAGLIARRIVFTKQPGDYVSLGERVGMIRFGSRADVLFGPEWHVEVREGMRVLAGSSVLARRAGTPEPLEVRTVALEESVLCPT